MNGIEGLPHFVQSTLKLDGVTHQQRRTPTTDCGTIGEC